MKRLISLSNTLDQNVTIKGVGVWDSSMMNGTGDSLINIEEASQSNIISSNGTAFLGSEYFPALKEFGDSVFVGLTMGSTAPTTGDVIIMIKEV